MPPALLDYEAWLAEPRDPDACWPWPGHMNRDGYGSWKKRGAHRVVYELLVGAVPRKLDLDHLCRNRACVNPAHLEPVTHRENILRGVSPFAVKAAATHCKSGHEFTTENTYIREGNRSCRACNAAAVARYKQQKALA